MTTYKEEVQRQVLNRLLDKAQPGQEITEKDWEFAYKMFRAEQLIQTLEWRLNNLWVPL